MNATSYTAVIVAAGRGERAGGGEPKQFRPIAGRPMLAWSVQTFADDPACAEIIVAVAPGGAMQAAGRLGALASRCRFVDGGETRTGSVRNAVSVAGQPCVLVHDAARPLVTAAIITDCLAALETAPAAAPAMPVADALARDGAEGLEAIDRTGLYRIQTPQAFHTGALLSAFAAHPGDFPDEVSLARAAGLDVALVPGDEANFKVTWPEDFERAELVLKTSKPLSLTVTGMGYDVHRLVPGDGVHLCGVFIPCDLHLVGHSDADAGLHAITDALLGAASLGDIGEHFPPSDDRWKGADSVQFLEHAVRIAAEAGARPVHCDVTLICERPKIGPHKAAMKQRVAGILGIAETRVNIKATTTEKLGFTGRGEGLAAEAVVTCQVQGAT
ncbi:MAG: bifunctional 2-C-methyl-D-erythritol 4-phosphate cytidylyltransferase/2-C-methyl-D-erythritol 2,4-cyclodiphosphate synthase [Alphaproteobacteria bacterium]|nr:bifunctional 2-C-methyl-D-erythritol 4-phosphate cytidylyltransferase/2-C-methyl-D-erythritol 2,4-cyclodiphosphate synthase [Alphaproteobacteria bacterium]